MARPAVIVGAAPPMQADADALLDAVKELNATALLDELDEAAVRVLSFTARGDLAPLNAFIGGLAAQEVIKVTWTGLMWAAGCSLDGAVVDLLRCPPTGLQQEADAAPPVVLF